MTLIVPAAEALPPDAHEPDHDYAERLALASIRNSIENLLTFPCVNILHGRGKLHLHGAMFDVKTGLLRTPVNSGVNIRPCDRLRSGAFRRARKPRYPRGCRR